MNDMEAWSDRMATPSEPSTSFDAVVDRYYKNIFNLVLRMVGDYEEAADLTQDVFVQAHRALARFRGEAKLSTWIYRIAVNRCKNRIKQLSRTGAVVAGSIDDHDAEEGQPRELPDIHFEPGRVLERQELRAIVNHEINQLSSDFRLVIVLRDLQGLSYKEMADVIGISLEAVKSRLFRARSQLRERLRPYLSDDETTHHDGYSVT